MTDTPRPATLAVPVTWKPCAHGGGWWVTTDADGREVLLPSETPRIDLTLIPWAKVGMAVMQGWPETGDIEGFDLQVIAEKAGVLIAVDGGFDPAIHHDPMGDAEAGDDWFQIIKRPVLDLVDTAITEAYEERVANTGFGLELTIEAYYLRQIEWSRETFGSAPRTKGIIDHITKELREIEDLPNDLSEWIDVVILAMDGFWRHGGRARDFMPALLAKQKKNMARTWPDWRTMSEDAAIEHDRGAS